MTNPNNKLKIIFNNQDDLVIHEYTMSETDGKIECTLVTKVGGETRNVIFYKVDDLELARDLFNSFKIVSGQFSDTLLLALESLKRKMKPSSC